MSAVIFFLKTLAFLTTWLLAFIMFPAAKGLHDDGEENLSLVLIGVGLVLASLALTEAFYWIALPYLLTP